MEIQCRSKVSQCFEFLTLKLFFKKTTCQNNDCYTPYLTVKFSLLNPIYCINISSVFVKKIEFKKICQLGQF